MSTEVEDESRNTGHVLGTQLFMEARLSPGSSFQAASFLVALRQEIFISFLTRRGLACTLDDCFIQRDVSPTDDWTWAHRMIVHTADILTSCYGPNPLTAYRWKQLKDYADKWNIAKPSSFQPLFCSLDVEETFPKLWYANDCHGSSAFVSLAIYLLTYL